MKPNSIASDIEALDPADDAALAEDTFESIGKFFERALIGTAMMKMS